MKVGIITRRGNNSPSILAAGLKAMLSRLGVEAEIFDSTGFLRRLLPIWKKPRHWHLYPHRRIFEKFRYAKADNRIITNLRTKSTIFFCECFPNGFWRNYYDLESLRKQLPEIPIIFYEVQYIENVPTQVKRYLNSSDFGVERFDWHLTVSDTTELRNSPQSPCSCIGLDLHHAGLQPVQKKGFLAIIDFLQPGYERYREEQIKTLKELNIETVVLKGEYPIDEIRKIYRQGSVFFIQCPESFGISIAENLSYGSCIFTPDSSWPMAFRINKNPLPNEPGRLPNCFVVYTGREELKNKLIEYKNNFDSVFTPKTIFNSFMKHYPHFYSGDLTSLEECLANTKKY